jgi:membrane protease YdiL (CAAX protease family)
MLLTFFSLTYLVSWMLFAAAVYALHCAPTRSDAIGPLAGLLFIPGAIVPALVALAITARSESRKGVSALFRGIIKWRANIGWYLFALGYMAAVKLSAALLYRVMTDTWPMFSSTHWYLIALIIPFSTLVQAGEEIGWRGFALPRLAKRFGLAWASIILGLLWSCWHLPFFFIPGSDNYGQSFSMYLPAVTAISVAMAWLYWRTNGSLLLLMIMHAAIDNTAGIVRSPISAIAARNPFALSPSLLAWLTVALLWICAAYFLIRMRGRFWSIGPIRLPIF